MTKLSVNVNKVATLRNTRTIGIPSITRAAQICLEAGAHGITVHPRPDARHIRTDDVYEIAAVVKQFPGAEYNIEGNPFIEFMEFAKKVRPTQCTLVPDSPDAFTSNQGFNMPREFDRLKKVIAELHQHGCRVSIFLDAVPEWCQLARDAGADRIELYTEPYATAYSQGTHKEIVKSFAETARAAADAGLRVNAGHDLNRENLGYFLTEVPEVEEVSIGHALIADALEFGYRDTIQKYLAVIQGAGRK